MARESAGKGSFNELVDLKQFIKTEFTAYYLGTKEVEGHGEILQFKDNDGKLLDAWSSGKLKYLFKDVPRRCRVFIKYLGLQKDVEVELPPARSGGKPRKVKKDVHDYTVEFDKDDTIK